MTTAHILPTPTENRRRQLKDLFQDVTTEAGDNHKMILADFNVGWMDDTGEEKKDKSTRLRLLPELHTIAEQHGMVMVPFLPSEAKGTHNSGAFIDLIFISTELKGWINGIDVVDTTPDLSDHRLILVKTDITWQEKSRQPQEVKPLTNLKRVRGATMEGIEAYHNRFERVYRPPRGHMPTTDERWDAIRTGIKESVEALQPPRKRGAEKLNEERDSKIAKFDIKGTRSKEHNLTHRKMATEKEDIQIRSVKKHIERRMKGIALQPKTAQKPRAEDTTTTFNEEEIISHFQKIGEYNGPENQEHKEGIEKEVKRLLGAARMFVSPLNKTIEMKELTAALIRQKKGKQGGLDDIPIDLLLWLPADGLQALLELYNMCLEANTMPKGWTEGVIRRILKPKRDPNLNGSYRPITLLSTAWKTLESILLRRMINLGIPEQLLQEQMAFKKGTGCRSLPRQSGDTMAQCMRPSWTSKRHTTQYGKQALNTNCGSLESKETYSIS
eukprot:Lithocolla_globosa_v1_NODE_132_length_5923_cov_39.615883.p1 type:complete len:499 gc:universal NODE_132_length_5923_cov_39.615883:2366-870(-)